MSSRRRYEVLATIGSGGMGTVYLARLRTAGDFEKDVAIKVLNETPADDPDDIARRLRDEARILGLIRHRAVVYVDGLLKLGGRWSVVMEYIAGIDLDQLFELGGGIPVGCALEVASEVAGALHVAQHSLGPDGRELKLLHRDIKPANIRVTPAGELKVLDFGVARAEFDSREAETKQASFGSIGYVPQERIDGIDVPAGDIYSLGAVVFEMLAGERYGQVHLVRKKHEEKLNGRLESLVDRGVPKNVRDLVRQMMAYEPTDRPTAREVERRAVQLRNEVPGVLLRDWAENRVPELMQQARKTLSGPGLTGEILVEDATEPTAPSRLEAQAPPPSAPPTMRNRALTVSVVGLLVALVIGAVLFAGVGGMLVGKNL